MRVAVSVGGRRFLDPPESHSVQLQASLPPAMTNSRSLSVVIPVYNSEDILPELLRRLNNVLPQIATEFEVVLVNDGSSDGSWIAITRLTQEYGCVRGIDLMRNYGQHNALLCGIRQAKHDVIVTLDDDLQNPPEEIPTLLGKLTPDVDVVYGTPQQRQHGLWRTLAAFIIKVTLQGAMKAEIARQVSAFRVLRTSVREAFAGYRSPFVCVDVLLTWGTSRFAAVRVRHMPRHGGRSHYSLRKLMAHALNMVTGFTTLPLQLASIVGFAFTFFGMAVLVYVIGRYLVQGDSVPGFPFLASIIAIFSGGQLFALGIIGEYLARMHFRTMERPSYCVRSETTSDVALRAR
jgi:glycosyltransferase involved in cell wall biosynthesis